MPFSLKYNCLNRNTVTLQKVDRDVQVPNVLEERNIKETNYEFKIPQQCFQKVILNNCDNLLKNDSCNLFKEALVIKEVKYDWNEKMKAVQKKEFN